MPFGGKKDRVIQEPNEALERAKLLAEVTTNIDVIEKFASAFISIQLMFWKEIANDQNIPAEIKLEVWKHSVSEFWETVRSGGVFTLSETVKRVGEIIRDAVLRAIKERE